MSEILLHLQDKQSDAFTTSEVGATGERLAAEFLIKNGCRIILSNFKVPVGRNIRGAIVTGEIDLIAYDADVLCFVEVKTRSSDDFASPLAAVDLRKQRQIIRAARIYRKIFQPPKSKTRYDVVSIVLNKDLMRPQIDFFKNYFNEAKFQKSFWTGDY